VGDHVDVDVLGGVHGGLADAGAGEEAVDPAAAAGAEHQLGGVAAAGAMQLDSLTAKFLGVLAKADREYHDVILASMKDGVAPINDKTKPLLEIIAKYTNLPVEQVVGNCAYIDPDGKLDVKNVDNQIKWLQEQGFADKGFDANAIIAKDYVKAD